VILTLVEQIQTQRCYISLETQQWKQTFQCYMLHLISNTIIEAGTFRFLWRGDVKESWNELSSVRELEVLGRSERH
jgi:hypothetical protein